MKTVRVVVEVQVPDRGDETDVDAMLAVQGAIQARGRVVGVYR